MMAINLTGRMRASEFSKIMDWVCNLKFQKIVLIVG
jgi:hypothetical protein